jgi:organic radical activating enzyme
MQPKKMILCIIPNKKCNLKCKYCYISQIPDWYKQDYEFKYSIEHIAQCLAPERFGGPCLVNLTGEGETMIQAGIVELCRLLAAQGHYIEFVTNLTVTKVVDEFMSLPDDILSHIEFKVSFHYHELKRLDILDKFWSNLDKVQHASCSFTLELMPNDELVPEIGDIIELCKSKVGAKCHLTVGRADNTISRGLLTSMTEDEYAKTWSVFESSMFDLKMKLLNVKRREFCYAGDWTLFVNMYSGEATPCYGQPYKQNIFDDPSKPIKFCAVGHHCVQPYCINGHAHISLGVIPEYASPTYAEIRNREREDGSEWFKPALKEVFDIKLSDTNLEYTKREKIISSMQWYVHAIASGLKHPKRVIQKIKLFFAKKRN